jgi:hypothetical protein
MRRILASIILAALAAGCASVPMAPPERNAAAKEFRTTPGKANVYIFRDESFGGAVKMSIVLDGMLFGDTAAKTFLLATVAPGKHVLISKAENDDRLEFQAEAGKNLYVWQEIKMGVWAARSRLELVDEAAAKPRVLECSLAENALPPAPAPAAPAAAAVPGT